MMKLTRLILKPEGPKLSSVHERLQISIIFSAENGAGYIAEVLNEKWIMD